MLKKMINEQNQINKKMATNQLRIKKATENILKTIEEAKTCKPAPEPKPRVKDPDVMNEFKNLVSNSYNQGTSKK